MACKWQQEFLQLLEEVKIKYNQINIEAVEINEEEIEEKRLFNVFVVGLPRSGTSMTTGICEKLGVHMIHTSDFEEKLKKRNEQERKRYGDEYQMNIDGFFEITDNVWDHYMEIMSTPYSGCKMIIPVTNDRMHVVKFNPCARVIQMWRDPEEIRQSQQAAYDGDKYVTEEMAETKKAIIRTQLVQQKLRLEHLKIKRLDIQYRDVLNDPIGKITEIAQFIKAINSIKEAVDWVNPSKNRFKKEELADGI